MNDQTPNQPSTSSSAPDLQAQATQALQKQINLILVAMIFLTCVVGGYLWLQARHLRADVFAVRPTHAAVKQSFANDRPTVQALAAKLVEYGRMHPDFSPIVKKYDLQPATNASASIPATAPTTSAAPSAPAKAAPATAPANKK